MKPQETVKLQEFLRKLLDGAVDLGLASLPLLAIYNRAKDEKLDFWSLVLTDPEMGDRLIKRLRARASTLPPAMIEGLRLVVKAADEGRAAAAAAKSAAQTAAADLDV